MCCFTLIEKAIVGGHVPLELLKVKDLATLSIYQATLLSKKYIRPSIEASNRSKTQFTKTFYLLQKLVSMIQTSVLYLSPQ